jgi:hypothetical protein
MDQVMRYERVAEPVGAQVLSPLPKLVFADAKLLIVPLNRVLVGAKFEQLSEAPPVAPVPSAMTKFTYGLRVPVGEVA